MLYYKSVYFVSLIDFHIIYLYHENKETLKFLMNRLVRACLLHEVV